MIAEAEQAATLPTMCELVEAIVGFGSASLGKRVDPAGRCPETGEPNVPLTTSPERTPSLREGNSGAGDRIDDCRSPAR